MEADTPGEKAVIINIASSLPANIDRSVYEDASSCSNRKLFKLTNP